MGLQVPDLSVHRSVLRARILSLVSSRAGLARGSDDRGGRTLTVLLASRCPKPCTALAHGISSPVVVHVGVFAGISMHPVLRFSIPGHPAAASACLRFLALRDSLSRILRVPAESASLSWP
jgi:hypothetical protein